MKFRILWIMGALSIGSACETLTSPPPSSPSPMALESPSEVASAAPHITKISFERPVPGYPKVLIPGVELEVVAGSLTESGFKDGKGQEARFNGAISLVPDGEGGFFFLDYNNHALRHLDRVFNVTTVLGGEAKIGMGSFEETYILKPYKLWRSGELLYVNFQLGIFAELNLTHRTSRIRGYIKGNNPFLPPEELNMLNQALKKSGAESLLFDDDSVQAYHDGFLYIDALVIDRINIYDRNRSYYVGQPVNPSSTIEDGAKEEAVFLSPFFLQFNASGDIYLLDGDAYNTDVPTYHKVVRKISTKDWSVSTIIGPKSVAGRSPRYIFQEIGDYDDVTWPYNYLYVTEPFIFLSSYNENFNYIGDFKVGYKHQVIKLIGNVKITSAYAEGDFLYVTASGVEGEEVMAAMIYRLSLKQLEQALLAQNKGAQ